MNLAYQKIDKRNWRNPKKTLMMKKYWQHTMAESCINGDLMFKTNCQKSRKTLKGKKRYIIYRERKISFRHISAHVQWRPSTQFLNKSNPRMTIGLLHQLKEILKEVLPGMSSKRHGNTSTFTSNLVACKLQIKCWSYYHPARNNFLCCREYKELLLSATKSRNKNYGGNIRATFTLELATQQCCATICMVVLRSYYRTLTYSK